MVVEAFKRERAGAAKAEAEAAATSAEAVQTGRRNSMPALSKAKPTNQARRASVPS